MVQHLQLKYVALQTPITLYAMKRMLILTLMALPLFATMACSDHDERIIAPEKLPADVTAYLNTHFPSYNIVQATKERELVGGAEYTVWLSEGYKIEFRKGNATDIESTANKPLPDTVIPQKILEYVATNYNTLQIVEWQIDDNGLSQEVRMNNGLELVFSPSGDFLRIDS